MTRPWFPVASRIPIQGIVPPQYSGCRLLGVCPDSSLATEDNGVQLQPSGLGKLGNPTESAYRPGITATVASRPPVMVWARAISPLLFVGFERCAQRVRPPP